MKRIQCNLMSSDEGKFCLIYSEYPFESVIFEPEEHRAMTPQTIIVRLEDTMKKVSAKENPYEYVANLAFVLKGSYVWATRAVVIDV